MLKDFIDSIKVIDAHEHIIGIEERKYKNIGFFGMLHYLESDFVTVADISWGYFEDDKVSFEEKSKRFLDEWHKVMNTNYARHLKIAMCDLYGVCEFDKESLIALDKKIKTKSNDKNWYKHVLKDKSNIEMAFVMYAANSVDCDFFKSILYCDQYLWLEQMKTIMADKLCDRNLYSYEAYLEQQVLEEINMGMVALKLAIAYWRNLNINVVSLQDAQSIFNKICEGKSISKAEEKDLQDYLIGFFVKLSIKYDLPMQIHTGHQEPSATGNGNDIRNSNVELLIPFIGRNKKVTFVLLHCGFPYIDAYLTIIKNYSNVYMDFSWIYVISQYDAKVALHKAIEMIPNHRIIGFGGDYLQVELAYAHQKTARRLINSVLNEKINDGYLTQKEAKEIAVNILRDNAIGLYKLNLSM